MSGHLILLITFVSVTIMVASAALLIHDLFFRYKSQVGERLDELNGNGSGDGNTTLLDLKLLAVQAALPKDSYESKTNDWLLQAGLTISFRQLFILCVTAGTASAVLICGISRVYWLFPIVWFAAAAVPVLYVKWKFARRVQLIGKQLPDALDAMARAVRAGQTVPSAMQLIADEFQPPLSEEFWHCYEQQQLGLSFDSALRELARRSCVMELRILVIGLLVQSRSGGNLTELLSSLSGMARKRIRMQHHIRALTGEGRMQALVLIVLPIAAFVALVVLSPDYAKELIKRPWMLGTTVIAQILGALWIRKLIRIDF